MTMYNHSSYIGSYIGVTPPSDLQSLSLRKEFTTKMMTGAKPKTIIEAHIWAVWNNFLYHRYTLFPPVSM